MVISFPSTVIEPGSKTVLPSSAKTGSLLEKYVAVILLAVLATACSKPENKELAGTWRWTSTTGGIAGVFYTPESEGFEAEIVFKGSQFTFYKDGKKVTSGTYRIDYDEDDTYYIGNKPFYSRFRFHISGAQVKKISEATNGTISRPVPPQGGNQGALKSMARSTGSFED